MKIKVSTHWFVMKINLEYHVRSLTVLRYIIKINVSYHYFLYRPRGLLILIGESVNKHTHAILLFLHSLEICVSYVVFFGWKLSI